MEQITYNGEGNHEFRSKGIQKVTIKTFEPFVIQVKGKNEDEWDIVGPNSAMDRKHTFETMNGEEVKITTKSYWTIQTQEIPMRSDPVDGESLVEIVSEGEMNLYDRMRSEMLGLLSQYAEKNGHETLDEADDLDFEDDDENLIDTPYEYQVLKDEYLAQRPQDEPYKDEFEKKSNTDEKKVIKTNDEKPTDNEVSE